MAFESPFVIEVKEKDDDSDFEKGVATGLGIAGLVIGATALTQTLINKKKIDELEDRVYDLECADDLYSDYYDGNESEDPGYEEAKEETGHSDLDNALLSSSK